MKANYKNRKYKEETVAFSRIKVCFDKEGNYSLIPLVGIYGIPINGIGTSVPEEIIPLLKHGLIEGEDRFLTATHDYTENSFCFEIFMYNIKFDLDFFVRSEYDLAEALIRLNIIEPRIITFF